MREKRYPPSYLFERREREIGGEGRKRTSKRSSQRDGRDGRERNNPSNPSYLSERQMESDGTQKERERRDSEREREKGR